MTGDLNVRKEPEKFKLLRLFFYAVYRLFTAKSQENHNILNDRPAFPSIYGVFCLTSFY
jgi:hypothetical protein